MPRESALEGELAKWSSSTVEVNRLIGCYQAYRLPAEEPGVKADGVAYGTYRDAWCQLVERHDKDTPAEGWRLLVGLEAECRELFARAAKDGLSKAACLDGVKGLLRMQRRGGGPVPGFLLLCPMRTGT